MLLRRRAVNALGLVALVAAAGCTSLLSADPTPVPGAAATLTRSIRTPIPTTERATAPSPGASVGPARPANAASPSPSPATGQTVTDTEVAQLQRHLAQIVASPSLPGVEDLLLDHVSLSSPQGGSVMDNAEAAAWLREHAGPGTKVTSVEQGTQSVMLQVLTDGWPIKDPLQQGQVTFSLRRYNAAGRPDEEHGDWKIDVIEAL